MKVLTGGFARCVVLAMLALLPTLAGAQRGRAGGRANGASVDTVQRADPRSPRAAVAEFLSLTSHGQYAAAARFLGSSGTAELARKLKAVLDQGVSIDLDLISPLASGDTADGLPNGAGTARDQLGAIRNKIGVQQSIQLVRAPIGAEPAWTFTPSTVERIDAWYDALGDHWLRDWMPEVLQRPGPFGIELWQWATLAFLLVLAMGVGWIAGRITIAIARRAARKTETTVDDRLIERARVPLLALWSLLAYRGLVEFIGLSITAEWIVGVAVRAGTVVIVTWLAVRATHVLEEELPASSAGNKPEIRSFAPLIGLITRIFVVALGAIAILSQFGYSVTALLTGVGIGGIALAFAAQKTLEHPFGSIAIGLDQPIRVGDWVKIGEIEGEVAAIGLRSTRVRTLARTIVVFPNGRLAEMPMENFGVRDRILLRAKIGLTYETSVAQMRRVRDEMERVLKEHPLVWPDTIIVRMRGFGESALEFDVIAWIATSNYNIFRAAREEIYLRFMEIVEENGCAFAYPTRTVRLVSPLLSTSTGAEGVRREARGEGNVTDNATDGAEAPESGH